MDIDTYLAEVDRLAAEADARSLELARLIEGLKGASPVAEACVDFRGEVATEAERDGVEPYLQIGFFADADPERRKAWWLFYFDIGRTLAVLGLRRACAPYAREQPLFVGASELFEAVRRREGTGSPDLELLDDRAVSCVHGSDVYEVGSGFGRLAQMLKPQIANWARDQFPQAPRFLRLDPWEFHHAQPPMVLLEAALTPADPKWLSTLALFPRTQTYAAYVLQDADPKTDPDQFIDYRLQGVRRLEVTAQRREADYLSMMLEELPRDDNDNGLMVGRCIHLDTRARPGTPMRDARLQHLDLAINVYLGADRAARMADSLQDGKVRDATFRTHLLRVEDVPFPALFGFAQMFFASQILFREWVAAVLPTALAVERRRDADGGVRRVGAAATPSRGGRPRP